MALPSIIAIDGPAGSGKSTISYKLAERYGYLFVDTGIFYRTVTLLALHQGLPLDDQAALTALAAETEIDIVPAPDDPQHESHVFANGQNVTGALRTADVEAAVSTVSAVKGVREALLQKQRDVAAQGNIIMAGRDIGTVVLPFADIKLYIDASLEERARRRYQQQLTRGAEADYDAIHTALQRRDRIDSERTVSPLRVAPDAIYIDTDNKSIEETVDEIAQRLEKWQPAEQHPNTN